jgi:sporulation protein YlmC with PRC-barrel domain
MANNDMDRVVPLGQLDDFKVAEGDPDVRGWEVLASDGRKIGEVDELLVDTNAMKVRYLDVDVDDGVIGDGMDRHVLIPIGYARLEQERDCVMVDGLASADLNALPSYDQGPLTRDFESSVRDSFAGRRADSSTGGTMAGGPGIVDTAGMDNTPGMGTAMGTTGAGLSGAGTSRDETRMRNEDVPDGAGMRGAGYDMDGETTRSPLSTGSTPRDTGSPRTGLDRDPGTTGGGLSAGSAGGPGLGSGGAPMSAGGASGVGTAGSGNAPMSAGSQGPVAGMGTDRGPQGDMSHRAGASSGMAGSDYLHNADEDFYASDAFDDSRFYGARRGGPTGDVGGGLRGGGADLGTPMGGGMGRGTGGVAGGSDGGMRAGGTHDATGGDGAASREEVSRLADEASERLREDRQNRGVGGSGGL